IFHNAPRAVSILKRSPFLLKAKPFATRGWEPSAQGGPGGVGQPTRLRAAFRVVAVTVIKPGGRSRISRPTPPTPLASRFTSFDIALLRHTTPQFIISGMVALEV